MKFLRKLDQALSLVEKGSAVFLFSALILLIALNIITRNIFRTSFEEILEISPVLVLWLALVGSLMALRDNRHIKIEIFLRYTSIRTRLAAHVVSSVFGMTVTGVLLIASFEFVVNEIAVFGLKGFFAVIFPLFFCGSFFRFFIQLIDPAASNRKA
jgi:TRAP-type C4-dicarboxylate transport system permease small subunit